MLKNLKSLTINYTSDLVLLGMGLAASVTLEFDHSDAVAQFAAQPLIADNPLFQVDTHRACLGELKLTLKTNLTDRGYRANKIIGFLNRNFELPARLNISYPVELTTGIKLRFVNEDAATQFANQKLIVENPLFHVRKHQQHSNELNLILKLESIEQGRSTDTIVTFLTEYFPKTKLIILPAEKTTVKSIDSKKYPVVANNLRDFLELSHSAESNLRKRFLNTLNVETHLERCVPSKGNNSCILVTCKSRSDLMQFKRNLANWGLDNELDTLFHTEEVPESIRAVGSPCCLIKVNEGYTYFNLLDAIVNTMPLEASNDATHSYTV